jgi:hypothetical protein
LPNYIAYVENQKEHHASRSVIPVLERTAGEGPRMIREEGSGYAADEQGWRREMESLWEGWWE